MVVLAIQDISVNSHRNSSLKMPTINIKSIDTNHWVFHHSSYDRSPEMIRYFSLIIFIAILFPTLFYTESFEDGNIVSLYFFLSIFHVFWFLWKTASLLQILFQTWKKINRTVKALLIYI